MAMEMAIIIAAFLGALIGSFLGACVYRLPIQYGFDQPEDADGNIPATRTDPNLTLSTPARSFCPSCKAQLRWFHNVPIVSWIVLRGRCGMCNASIPVRYPLIELLSAYAAVLSVGMYGATPTALVVYLFCAALLVISFIDYDFFIIPDVISIPATAIGFGIAILNYFTHWFFWPIVESPLQSLYGFGAGAGFLYLVSEIYLRLRKKEGLGLGDVKLLAVIGALFGPGAALYTIFVGSLVGSVVGLILIIGCGRKASQAIPFGPYLAFAAVLYVFSGDSLIVWLLDRLAGGPHV